MALTQETVSLRSGTTAEWAASTLVLGVGELGLDLTTRDLRIGDGSTAFADLTPVGEVVSKGTATLVAGTVTVANTAVKADSIIMLTYQSIAGVSEAVGVGVSARVADTSFTILSNDNTDTSVIGYVIFTP